MSVEGSHDGEEGDDDFDVREDDDLVEVALVPVHEVGDAADE